MDHSAMYLSFFIIGHLGLSGREFIRVGWVQYLLHKLYAVLEPTILRITDFIFSIKLLTDTVAGREILKLVATAAWALPHGVVITTEAAERVIDFIMETEYANG
ncbi:MAG: hypothetical protein J7J85_04930, partial [Deltaproteobacteria bacterium]|nr:hypothetical protein [Deltaproteobacteria bacterium]